MDSAEAERVLQSAPFHTFLDASFAAFEPGRVVVEVPFREELVVNEEYGVLHGGVLASLLDIAGHYAVFSEVGQRVPTADLRIDYLRPATAGDLAAEATVRRIGSNLAVADATAYQDRDGDRVDVAIGRGAYGVSRVDRDGNND